MMKDIGREIHQFTGVFALKTSPGTGSEQPRVLDMCMAPGGFLATALDQNPEGFALAFSLPVADRGHKVLLPSNPKVKIDFLDITMLAADMGVEDIPVEHPDAKNFLAKRLADDEKFDLVICDGQVLRTHPRSSYRETREARRLTLTQLALGLEHMKPGGTMLVLLHKIEAWDTVLLLHTFSIISSMRLFKPVRAHGTRSSFYMIATNVQPQHQEAILAIDKWKKGWKIATFGTEEEHKKVIHATPAEVENILDKFGPELVRLGKDVWRIQAAALENAPFIKGR